MKRIAALSALEPAFRVRLVTTQLYRPLSLAISRIPQCQAEFWDLTPWPFYFKKRNTIAEYRLEDRQRRALIREYKDLGMPVRFVRTIYPWHPRYFIIGRRRTLVFVLSTLPYLLALIRKYRPQLIIARNYPAGLLALMCRRLSEIPYIFDPRGLYPEHGLNAKTFVHDSPDYLFWKRWEKKIIQTARACVAVSEPFLDHVRRIDPGAKVFLIPCGVDAQEIRYDPELRIRTKKEFGLENNFILLHLGSFGTEGDHQLVARYLKRFRFVKPEAVLVVATGTPAFAPRIREAFLGEGLAESDFRIILPRSGQLDEVRALGDAGLILERRSANSHVCLSVKFGEYLASGMPVICTPFVEGAARLVEKYHCGLIVDPDDEGEPLDKERAFLREYDDLRSNGFRLVREYLSLEGCAQRWQGMIEEVLEDI